MKKGARLDQKNQKIYLLLDNIRSVHNVGSIFRTADAFGVSKIYLAGCTPSPLDRFGRERADLAKVALGAEKQVSWEYLLDAVAFVEKMGTKKRHDCIVALEQDPRAIVLNNEVYDIRFRSAVEKTKSILLILGNEVSGVDPKLLDLADEIIEIPMRGTKESLNVSVSAGIALFAIADARYKNGRSGRRPLSV